MTRKVLSLVFFLFPIVAFSGTISGEVNLKCSVHLHSFSDDGTYKYLAGSDGDFYAFQLHELMKSVYLIDKYDVTRINGNNSWGNQEVSVIDENPTEAKYGKSVSESVVRVGLYFNRLFGTLRIRYFEKANEEDKAKCDEFQALCEVFGSKLISSDTLTLYKSSLEKRGRCSVSEKMW
jgi:hypothetical protein